MAELQRLNISFIRFITSFIKHKHIITLIEKQGGLKRGKEIKKPIMLLSVFVFSR